MRLYDYWRSSAAYRVRIALNLKGLAYEQVAIDLRAGTQSRPPYSEKNPQALVPMLEDGARRITQSLAIVEYLEEVHPEPALLPREPVARGQARALALLIACEIHPLNNLRVLRWLESDLAEDEPARLRWYRHWMALGLGALERQVAGDDGPFCVGEWPMLPDLCLVPQLYNARRYDCDLDPYPTLRAIDARCRTLPAFAAAAPERQPDAAA